MKTTSEAKRWNDLTIAELMYFERLGTTLSESSIGSMAQVEKLSGITHAHSYQTLKKLEGKSRFGVRLVNRNSPSLTGEGLEVLAYARKVLAAYRLRPLQTARRVTLRIAATNRILTTLLASYFPAFIEDFRKNTGHDLNIEILEATFDQTLAWLEIGEVELAFGGVNTFSQSHPKLVHKSIRKDLQVILVAPPKGTGVFTVRRCKAKLQVTLNELESANLCLIRRDKRGDFRNIPEPANGFSQIIVDNYSAVLAMVRAGACVGLMINFGIPSDLLKFEISDTSQKMQDFAVWRRKGSELSMAAQSLNDAVGVSTRKRTSNRPLK